MEPLSEPLRTDAATASPRPEPPMRNPYAPPGSRLDGPALASGGSDGVSSLIQQHLRQTKPWVRLMAVVGFLVAGFQLLVALSAFIGGAFVEGIAGEEIPVALIGVVYLLLGFLSIVPAVYLWRYATAIGTLLDSQRLRDLETALACQKSYWRFLGIMVTVFLVIVALGLVAAIGIAIVASVAS